MAWTIQQLAYLVNESHQTLKNADGYINYISIDSRQIFVPRETLFIALKGKYVDGHQFIEELYMQGVRNFIISKHKHMDIPSNRYDEANFFIVDNVLLILQKIASEHRKKCTTQLIAITGSVGKTIVKDWIYTCLSEWVPTYKSPRSYNSKLGVPLSLCRVKAHHQFAVIEAGISQQGEMDLLQQMLGPDIGVLCHINAVHDEGFASRHEKIMEKISLLQSAKKIICADTNEAFPCISKSFKGRLYYWSTKDEGAYLYVKTITRQSHSTLIEFVFNNTLHTIRVPFLEMRDVENALLCLTTILALGLDAERAIQKVQLLQLNLVRWSIAELAYNNKVIYDTQHADLLSLSLALSKLHQQIKHEKYTIILSDLELDSMDDREEIYINLLTKLYQYPYLTLIFVGEKIKEKIQPLLCHTSRSNFQVFYFQSTHLLLQQLETFFFLNEAILVLGQRHFHFEQIIERLKQASHSTQIELNLTTLRNNIEIFKAQLLPKVKLMGMVKAFGYGSGLIEVAQLLEQQGFDYLGVAYADEGVELRKANIQLPIMVMNVEAQNLHTIIEHRLEPVLYSTWVLEQFLFFVKSRNLKDYPIHIKIDSGMHRLGIEPDDFYTILPSLAMRKEVNIQSIFSHFACSADAQEDAFTKLQFDIFNSVILTARTHIKYNFLTHISNTAAISRFPQYQLDMVRLGVGMYGLDPSHMNQNVQSIISLKTTISQIKEVKAGDRVGYGNTILMEDKKIATIRIGYADGFSKILGFANGFVYIKKQKAMVVGSVCMDMTMVDITHIADVQLGDEVEIIGNSFPFMHFCEMLKKDPYEVMCSFPSRLQKTYIEE